jgi:hypothetical protein
MLGFYTRGWTLANPTPGVIAEIKAFKAAKNVGCDFVVDYDNALHDPTRGVIAARGTYQIFAYCTPTLGYAFNYSEIGRNLNTGVPTGREVGVRACAYTSDEFDGLFICTGTDPVPIAPTSGHAEYFSIVILYIGTSGSIVNTFPVQATYDQVPINDKGVVYPKINASSLNFQGPDPSQPGIIPFPNLAVTSVTPPGTFHSCPDMGSQAAAGCVARVPAAGILENALEKVYTPPNYDSLAYTPHHIQPVCWGGNNSAANGVFLLTTDPLKLHAQFTAWWQRTSFSPDGAANPQPPAADNDC